MEFLVPNGTSILHLLTPKSWGSLEKRGKKECKSQRPWTTRKQQLLNITRHLHIWAYSDRDSVHRPVQPQPDRIPTWEPTIECHLHHWVRAVDSCRETEGHIAARCGLWLVAHALGHCFSTLTLWTFTTVLHVIISTIKFFHCYFRTASFLLLLIAM